MNNLEALKDKLRVKPIVQHQTGIKVVVAPPRKVDVLEETIVENQTQMPSKPFITAERDQGQRAKEILDKVRQKRLSIVVQKFPEPKEVLETKAPVTLEPTAKLAKKIAKKREQLDFIIEEDEPLQGQDELIEDLPPGGPRLEGSVLEIGEPIEKKKEIRFEEIEPSKHMDEEDLFDFIPTPKTIAKPRVRTTARVQRGVIPLGTEQMVKIGDTSLPKRLPPLPSFDVNVSSYYMNNREIFINFINGLFEPYKNDLLDESKGITCENIGKDTGKVGLLTHQKIVRDYMNLHTPYRGLLLYHGLGSGKTCSSIAIAEGMKHAKKVIVMTPASLRRNYMEEIKKCGDLLFRKNQFWEWISIDKNPEYVDALSASLNLPVEYIRRRHGAWLTNITKENNYANLSSTDKKSLNDQLDEMISSKYFFINYNGLRRDKFKQLTNDFNKNIFDDAVVIIDEAHNLISRIVNKINKISKTYEKKRGPDGVLPQSISLILYEFLLKAENCRVVLLTGTPIINYPNEIGILFNILRGYIKTWNFNLSVEGSKKLSKDALLEIFAKEKILDYVDYLPSSRTLTITRNPFGFENKITATTGYKGVTNDKKEVKNDKGELIVEERGQMSDAEFIKRIVKLLKKNDITAIENATTLSVNTALPDTLDKFIENFIDKNTGTVMNLDKFKRRIMGLTSYFRSAQEELLPTYDKNFDKHAVSIPMSNYQFKTYEEYRQVERKSEKSKEQKTGGVMDADGIFKQPTSTYRIFSRLACNFVMPIPPGRPLPAQFRSELNQNQEEKVLDQENPIIISRKPLYEKYEKLMKDSLESNPNKAELEEKLLGHLRTYELTNKDQLDQMSEPELNELYKYVKHYIGLFAKGDVSSKMDVTTFIEKYKRAKLAKEQKKAGEEKTKIDEKEVLKTQKIEEKQKKEEEKAKEKKRKDEEKALEKKKKEEEKELLKTQKIEEKKRKDEEKKAKKQTQIPLPVPAVPTKEEIQKDIKDIFGEESSQLDTDEIFKGGEDSDDDDDDFEDVNFEEEYDDDEINDDDENYMGGSDENPLEQFVENVEEKEEVEVNAMVLPDYKDEDAGLREAEELEGDELLAKMGGTDYYQAIQQALKYLKTNSKEFLTPTGLETYSPKFLAMLENIEDIDHKGLHLVYSQFRSFEGIEIFGLTLETNGFAKFKIKRTSSNSWELDMTEEDLGKPCYALYTGTEDSEEREILRNIYNGDWDNIPNNIAAQLRQISNNNDLGEVIRVLMITSAGSEGINLRNTRYVHIMEPYWHPVRVEQVIGRARRICSHRSLPKELQSVEVFVYIMTFTKEQIDSEFAIELRLKDLSKREPFVPQSSDEKLFEISTIKEQLTEQLVKGIKESSIDCATYLKSNAKEGLVCLSFGQPSVSEFSYNPNYAQDENDMVAAINRVAIDWDAQVLTLPNGKKYAVRTDTKQVYDYESVMQAKRIPGFRPILLGKLVRNQQGKYEIVREKV
uniref:Helicase ATP-binding domain-containing protein n=1 Tax=viral metagenome TaxID=1070528 RepID=A0A6C0ITH0_9ZZZZ